MQVTDHEEFFDYTLMNVQQFYYICDLVRPYLSKRSIRTPLSVELRMAITFEILARETSIRSSSWNYRIGHSTTHKIFKETCKALWIELFNRTDRTFGNEERIFNYRLSRARCVIENTFGIMTSRWRTLRRDLCCAPEIVEDIVKSIVCLHNFLMISEDDITLSDRTLL
ncbi:hypothetical protein ALC62_05714 [Cyphomyrmex costatus]|uniref:DDE Tnp4 domain-containing protein n=1 Tax=Cyphomyrmex costatus TaxID=456900 RepID=A0A151IJK8_9HYME|nr:hypothetical protein ALC62_05714 [Cyphomyrmex costatus]